MQSKEPSRTAMFAAISRGQHRLADPWPWVFDDPYALSLVGPGWAEIHARMGSVFGATILRQTIALAVGRARYVEDRLHQGTFSQYVILGAGLDSLAWRRPDILDSVRIFEIDHPATQLWKRERAEILALPMHENHIFAPVDFEAETLEHGLASAGFDWSQPTLFSWLGVTQYLTINAIAATLRIIGLCPPGSEVVLTYIPTREFLDDLGREFIDTLSGIAAERGEPVQALLPPADIERLIEQDCGLTVEQHLSRDDLHRRYFADRPDELTPPTTQRLIAAVVPGR